MTEPHQHSPFYSGFEARYRGSRELIGARLEVYRPFVEPLARSCKNPTAIDLGCGRGEWLELVNRLGYQSQGVDLDEGMLEACRARGLNVEQGDALDYLKARQDGSCVVVSSFHMVEHIPFGALQQLVEQSLRALKPGGLLIMETPNPENLLVSGLDFYLDPTHHKPIPPDLLSYLPEYHGFERVKILRLQHDPELAARQEPTLLDVLGGASPDYAVVARKAGDNNLAEATNPAFELEMGLTLSALAERYERRFEVQGARLDELQQGLEQVNSRAASTALRAERLAMRAGQLHAQNHALQTRLDESLRNAHLGWLAASAHEQTIQSLKSSGSWRITWPLRKGLDVVRWLMRVPGILFRPGFAPLLRRVMRFVLNRPRLRQYASSMLQKTPRIYWALFRFGRKAGLPVTGLPDPALHRPELPPATEAGATAAAPLAVPAEPLSRGGMVPGDHAEADLSHLTPRARRIHAQLKAALDTDLS